MNAPRLTLNALRFFSNALRLRHVGVRVLCEGGRREAGGERELAKLFGRVRPGARGLVDYLLRAFEVRFETEFAPQRNQLARGAESVARGLFDNAERGLHERHPEDARRVRAVNAPAHTRGLARNLD